MAQAPTSRIRHTGKLEDVTSARININTSQSGPFKAGDPYCLAPGIKTGVRYSPTQEKHLKQLLNSPHRAKVLRMNGISIDENTFMRSSKKSRSNTKLNSPRTPVSQGTNMAEQYAAASQINLKEGSGTLNLNELSPLDKELPPKPFLRNEESLEPRGVFDATDASSKKLNAYYPPLEPATAQPSIESSDSSLNDKSSFEIAASLKNLSDTASADTEVGVATQVDFHDVCDHAIPSITTSRPIDYALSAPRLAERRITTLGHVATHKDGSPIQRRKLNPLDICGQDALSNKGNSRANAAIMVVPIDKELPEAPKEDRMKSQGGLATGQRGSLGINKGTFISRGLDDRADSPGSEMDNTPLRRSNKYGIGPTIRFSKDAHEVIMGTGPPSSKMTKFKESKHNTHRTTREVKVELASPPATESNFRKPASSSKVQLSPTATGNPSKTMSQSSAEIFCQVEIEQAVSPFQPRTSSLPSSPAYLGFSNPPEPPVAENSLAARLSRPTKASQARATEPKTSFLRHGNRSTAANSPSLNKSSSRKLSPRTLSLKPAIATTSAVQLRKSTSTTSIRKVTRGFKSRLSSMIPGLRRAGQSKVNIQNFNKHRISEESIVDTDLLFIHANRRSASSNLTTYHNSGMDQSPMEVIHSCLGGEIFSGEPVDKMAPSRDESGRRADERHASQIHDQTNRSHFIANGLRSGRITTRPPGGEDEPPTPPESGEGPSGHYTETEQATPSASNNNRRPSSEEDAYDETGVGRYLDGLLTNAEHHFRAVIAATHGTDYQPTREAISEVLTPLAAAIEATRAARMSAIALSNANAELARWVAMLSERAGQVAIVATRASPPRNDAPAPNDVKI